MVTTTKAERKQADRIPCGNCGKSISADLYIEANERGFKKVHLGIQCMTCKALVPEAVFEKIVLGG